MFHVSGWISLAEVTSAVRSRHQRSRIRAIASMLLNGRDFTADEMKWNIETEVWQICQEVEEVAVLLSNGSVVLASKELIEGSAGEENDHVNIYVGTVGSGGSKTSRKRPTDIDKRYGPFVGLPILLPEECRDFAEGKPLVSGISSERDKPNSDIEDDTLAGEYLYYEDHPVDQSPRAVAKAIGEIFASGEVYRKSDYKEIFGPDMSVRQFEHAWKLATEQHPELSKPGRKPQETKS